MEALIKSELQFERIIDSLPSSLTIITLEGTVLYVNSKGMEYFEIEVLVPPAEMKKIAVLRGNSSLRAGMPAEIMVPLRQRTALGYLVEPLTQTLWKAGREH